MSDETTSPEPSRPKGLLEILGSFRDLLSQDYEHWKQTGNHSNLREINHQRTLIEIFVRKIDPDAVARMKYESGPREIWGLQPTLAEINRIIGVLQQREQTRTKEAGENVTLAADQLHPWVWGTALHFWGDAGYDSAVHMAAFAVAELTRRKVERPDVDDKDLYYEVFSTDAPQPGAPRLRFPVVDHVDEPEVWTSMHAGAQLFAMGCAHGIGDPETHSFNLTEQQALERLAALSVLAEWVNVCEVVRAAPSHRR